MAVSATTSATNTSTTGTATNPNGILGKDDFMKLLLTELQYQDPTSPMDTEKILTQTSQLATLESSDKTNSALESLAASLSNTQQFSTIAAIGKTADIGSDAISIDKGASTTFEIYFPNDVSKGSVEITDADGNVVKTLDMGTNTAGVYSFDWDGTDNDGNMVDGGIYHVNSTYYDANENSYQTRLGAYPIESVRFDSGETYLKLGSSYVALSNVKEVY